MTTATERKHAILSASSAHRWLVCTPSARLEETVPDTTSEYAEEGTHAHTLAEIRLRQALGEKVRLPNGFKDSPYYDQAMEDHVAEYVMLVMERIAEHRAVSPDALIMFEQRLDFSRWVPDGFGTGDVVIVSDMGLEVIDLKYGQGVPISAERNPQTRLYGLGAYDTYGLLYDIETILMTIVQPRLDSISTEILAIEELLAWANKTVRTQANLAWEGGGDFVPGEHCRFCRVKASCRARAEANLALARYDFKNPALLTLEELSEILHQIDTDFLAWTTDVQAYAYDQAMAGKKIPGYKLVEGRSSRKYADEEAIKQALKNEGYTEEQILKLDLKGITELERLLGKKRFNELLGEFIVKPPGKPTLVPESDKRPEINTAASAAADFAESA